MRFRIGLFMMLVLGLAACGSDSPPTSGEAIAFEDTCNDGNNGKRLAVEGYLILPDSFTDSTSVVLRLYESADLSGPPIGVQINFGTDPNRIEKVPTSYTDDDLKVHLADGSVVGYTTLVRVSGSVYYPLVGQDFVCGLENPLVERAS
ncbi:MAG: hypothetical protein K8J31_25270 [Anaerolineae bacterium]|nr:hypothetical protein [Anaerolineae bacterium]